MGLTRPQIIDLDLFDPQQIMGFGQIGREYATDLHVVGIWKNPNVAGFHQNAFDYLVVQQGSALGRGKDSPPVHRRFSLTEQA
jgi:hypothetical protein